jgi:hypothetical protein
MEHDLQQAGSAAAALGNTVSSETGLTTRNKTARMAASRNQRDAVPRPNIFLPNDATGASESSCGLGPYTPQTNCRARQAPLIRCLNRHTRTTALLYIPLSQYPLTSTLAPSRELPPLQHTSALHNKQMRPKARKSAKGSTRHPAPNQPARGVRCAPMAVRSIRPDLRR